MCGVGRTSAVITRWEKSEVGGSAEEQSNVSTVGRDRGNVSWIYCTTLEIVSGESSTEGDVGKRTCRLVGSVDERRGGLRFLRERAGRPEEVESEEAEQEKGE